MVTLLLLTASFLASLVIQQYFRTESLIPSVFVLFVFLVSLNTDGYVYGITAALLSVLAVNFAFTFPFFAFDFTIQENITSVAIMMVVTLATSALTSKLKRHEKMRIESEKEKLRANLLRAVSHDLRTPLTTIYGTSSTMIENHQLLSETEKLQLLQGIKEDSQWLIRMVENLLSVTRFDDNGVNLVKTPVVLEELVDAALGKFKKRYPAQAVSLSLPDTVAMVAADGILIQQVLVNLLENAVQHAKNMQKLQLTVTLERDTVLFAVIDDGCGMDRDRLKDVFKGAQLPPDSGADSVKKSMGIGLSVCASIVRAHGGRIWAENLQDGGMRFAFSLDREVLEDE